MTPGSKRMLAGAFVLALALVFALYRETFLSIVMKWVGDSSFSHGLLVVPISLWLCWTKREQLAAVKWRTEWLGVAALLLVGTVWFVARATGVLVIEQFAAMTLIPAAVLALLGRHAARALLFPLLFLMLAVPAGRGIVPWLMQNTADIAAAALRLSGVPVVRDGMILSIPGGDFEVARACSGLNYLVTGITLGALYSYLTYSSTRKRLLFMAAALLLPVVLNGIRAYLIIALAHLTDMRWGTGQEHVLFGRILFLAGMILLFWIGLRWRDPPKRFVSSSVPAQEPGASGIKPSYLVGALASLAAIVVPPVYLGTALAHARTEVQSQADRITLPVAAPGWQGPREDTFVWRPNFHGAIAERAATFTDASGGPVDVYVAAFGLGLSGGAEMISYRNRLSEHEQESLLPQRDVELDLAGTTFTIREFVVPGVRGARLAWRWYLVGNRVYRFDSHVKAAEALAYLSGGEASDRVLVVSSPVERDPDAARARLRSFIDDHSACVRSGFTPESCVP